MRDELYRDRARSAGGRFGGREPSRGHQAVGSARTMEILQDSVYDKRTTRASVAPVELRKSTAGPSARVLAALNCGARAMHGCATLAVRQSLNNFRPRRRCCHGVP